MPVPHRYPPAPSAPGLLGRLLRLWTSPPVRDDYRPAMLDTVFLDTETTGLFGDVRIVEIAIVDHEGRPLVDTLVNPGIPIPWQASKVHGIGDDDVAGMPSLSQLMPQVNSAVRNRRVVIYNASYDQRLFPCGLREARAVHCAMRRFKQLPLAAGRGNGTLSSACVWAGHQWTGVAHRALADALAARTVWQRLERERVPLI